MIKRNLVSTEQQKEMMMNALETNYGNVRMAAKVAGINVRTHYRWRKEDKRYELQTDSMKDLCFRGIKENLIDEALKKVRKGNIPVLNQMLRIFLKDTPEEMKSLRRHNDVPFKVSIKYVDTPQDPNNTYYRKPDLNGTKKELGSTSDSGRSAE